MRGASLPANVKRTSALRRVPSLQKIRYRRECGNEGDICAFQLGQDALPLTVEAPSGRKMAIAPGDIFLATPGHRAATRSVSGGIPAGGLVPGRQYWILADSGVIGEMADGSPLDEAHLGRVRYLGAVCDDNGAPLNIRQFAVASAGGADRDAPVYLILGTSGNVGKTTAGCAVLRMLRMQGYRTVIALKTTGTGSVAEIASYLDFGAAQAFDCVDFGLPGTYPVGRSGIADFLANALDFCLALPADALIVECGGDLASTNVLDFLAFVKTRRADPKIILAAADALGAFGAKQALAQAGLAISLITGPCTDTPAMRERTSALCGIPAISLAGNADRAMPV